MMKCPFCNFENEDGALFCEQCKSDLGVPQAVPSSEGTENEGPRMSAAFVGYSLEPGARLHAVAIEESSVTEAVPVAEVAAEASAAPEAAVSENIHLVDTAPVIPALGATPPAPALEEGPAASPPPGEQTMAATPEVGAGLAATPGAAEPAHLPEGAKPKLVVVRGQRVNAEYPLYEGDNYLGRADDKAVDVDLEDQEPPDRIWSSRQHALITFENGTLAIEDLNSTNGTFVNRTRVHPGQKRALQLNDVIQIGTVHLKIQI